MRILLVEDNIVNQKLAIRILERLGHQATIAANGVAAIEVLVKEPYDVVLMDAYMPEMDGIEATQRIRMLLPAEAQPWIIAMTADNMPQFHQRCLAAGMNDFLAKPTRVEDLQAAFDRVGKLPQNKL